MIELKQVSLRRGAKALLEKTDLRIHDGQKLALIGANGTGKSSLFALLLGRLGLDQGNLSIPKDWRIAHMAQEVEASDRPALDYVIDGDQYYRHIEQQITEAKDDNALAHWLSEMDTYNGYQIVSKAEQLLHGLGFSGQDMQRAVSDFSGGWRIRLNLAQALMTPSDLLLLDEPTNHLDIEATLWLEQWLNRYQGTLLFISHDRDFIDAVAGHIVHLSSQKLVVYPGNYTAYERIRSERLAQQQLMHDKQQARIADIEKFVTRFKAKASKAKQAQSRVKELERMELIAPAHVDSPFSFSFPCYEKVSMPLLSLEDADIGYQTEGETKVILHKQSLSIQPGHRIGLLGANGAGKSTLIKALCQSLPLLGGQMHQGEHLKLGYYAQHQLETLDVKASAVLMIQRLSPKASEQSIRNFLGGFDFRGDKALEPCEPFSGGEKARLALALVAWQKPNLLIMDEPTNHLDIEMREALTMALQHYAGAIVLVSHDRHLLKATVDEYWLVENNCISDFDGDLQDYHAHHKQQLKKLSNKQAAPEKAQQKKSDQSNETSRSSLNRKQQGQLNKLEKRIQQLSQKVKMLETELADQAIYEPSQSEQLKVLLDKQTSTSAELELVEEKWLALSEKN